MKIIPEEVRYTVKKGDVGVKVRCKPLIPLLKYDCWAQPVRYVTKRRGASYVKKEIPEGEEVYIGEAPRLIDAFNMLYTLMSREDVLGSVEEKASKEVKELLAEVLLL